MWRVETGARARTRRDDANTVHLFNVSLARNTVQLGCLDEVVPVGVGELRRNFRAVHQNGQDVAITVLHSNHHRWRELVHRDRLSQILCRNERYESARSGTVDRARCS